MPTVEELQAELATVTHDRDDLKGQLKTANDEAKGHRLNANKYKGQLEALQSELDTVTNDRDGLATRAAGDLERLRIDLTAQLNAKDAELQSRIHADRDARTNAALETAAAKLGMHDMDGLKLLDRAGLKVGEDGSVENLDEQIAAFKAAKPYLFGAAPRVGVATGTTQAPVAPPRPAVPSNLDARSAPIADVNAEARALGITTPFR
ncbi:phage scaffolding protein [Acetobacteraceae bacterium KSS8]|uniref:Phage scaffolding protein n=1 Tax=Endosaccharibacter trunci TaxID=2812733 RepID=A0ABT1WDI6_9PROT|nr:phage scaffolding protein [Acetobacteraceae bacterium KSS8]